jgi:hypothetical protein
MNMIKLSIVLIILLVLVLGCGGISSSSKTPEDMSYLAIHEYPSWFWNMPAVESDILSVGYSETYFREESSKDQSLKNGIENLAKSISVWIKGGQGFWNVGSQMAIAGGFEETVGDEVLQRVENNYKMLHLYKSESMTIALLSYGKSSGLDSPSNESIKPAEAEPSWLKELPKTRGYLYAIGNSEPYFRETQSWLSAEKNARVALASTLGVKLRSLVKQIDQQIEVVQAAEVSIELNRAQILSRWVDPKSGVYYVLARMSLFNNKNAAFNQLNTMIASPKAVINKEEVIEKAYKELESEINSLEKER